MQNLEIPYAPRLTPHGQLLRMRVYLFPMHTVLSLKAAIWIGGALNITFPSLYKYIW